MPQKIVFLDLFDLYLHQNVLNKTKYFICKTSTEFSEAQERTLVDFILNKKLEFSTRIITPGLPMILTLIIVQTIVLVLTLSLVLTVALVLTVMINLNEARKICHLCQTHQTLKNKLGWITCFDCSCWCCYDCLPQAFKGACVFTTYSCFGCSLED